MPQDARDASIVRSTIELGHALGLTVVAEGIEDDKTLSLLGSLGCDVAQGYHIGLPMNPGALTQWFRDRWGTDAVLGHADVQKPVSIETRSRVEILAAHRLRRRSGGL